MHSEQRSVKTCTKSTTVQWRTAFVEGKQKNRSPKEWRPCYHTLGLTNSLHADNLSPTD